MQARRTARAVSVGAFLICAFLSTSPAEAQAREVASTTVAVHPLKSLGLDLETLARLEEVLRGEMQRVPGVALVDLAATRAAADTIACDGKPECLGRFARKMKVSVAIYGVVAALGESYNITLKAVDPQGQPQGRVQKTIGGEEVVLIDGIRAAAYQLLRPDLFVGRLELQVPVDGAEVQIDGQTIGVTPLAGPIHGLTPGKHALKIISRGFSDFDKFVEVRFQRTSVVSVDLEGSSVSGVIYREEPPPPLVAVVEAPAPVDTPLPPPPLSPLVARAHPFRWVAIGAGGVALIAAGGALYYAGLANSASDTLSNRWKDENRGPDATLDAAAWSRFVEKRNRAYTFYAVAGVAAAAGAAFIAIDLLQDPKPAAASPSGSDPPSKPEVHLDLLLSPAPSAALRLRF